MRKLKKKLKHLIAYILLLGFIKLIRILPRNFGFAICGTLFTFGSRFFKREKRIIRKNINLIFPNENIDIEDFTKDVFRFMGYNAVDLIKMEKYSLKDMENIIQIDNFQILKDAYNKGKGVICLAVHKGNWELLGAYVSMLGYKVNGIYAPMFDKKFADLINQSRKKFGIGYIQRDRSSLKMLKVLRRGEMLAILMDQNIDVKSIDVEFFGHKASTPLGPIILAQKTGALIIPISVHLIKDKKSGKFIHKIIVENEIKMETNLDEKSIDEYYASKLLECNNVIKKMILYDKKQWVWFHKRWEK